MQPGQQPVPVGRTHAGGQQLQAQHETVRLPRGLQLVRMCNGVSKLVGARDCVADLSVCSPRSKFACAGGGSGELVLWNAASSEVAKVLTGHEYVVDILQSNVDANTG